MSDAERFWSRVQKGPNNHCWIWIAGKQHGYGILRVGGRCVRAHRYSFMLNSGEPIPEGMNVLHKCDNPACVRPDHLFLGTQEDNNHDRSRKNRNAKGETRKNAKLTTEDVVRIRELAAAGIPRRTLMHMFGISGTTVNNIKRRVDWKHVE